MLARTSFSQYEERLRRLLGLVGDIPSELGGVITPVVVLGDATAPGMPQWRGRRFAGAGTFGPGAAWSVQFKAGNAVVISRFCIQATAVAMEVHLKIVDANVADPFAITTLFAPFTERISSATDLAPLARSALPAAANNDGVQISQYRTNAVPSQPFEMIRESVYLGVGDKLNLRSGNVVSPVDFTIEGYVF